MYTAAFQYDDSAVFYFDSLGNKYVAQGGSLAWRINNPGLVRSRSGFAKKSIGSCEGFAIFLSPEQGRKALVDLLRAKTYYHSDLKKIAKLYQPKDLLGLPSLAGIAEDRKISSLLQEEFDCLRSAIEKLCGYSLVGNEHFAVLPKIYAHIESNKPPYDQYLVGDAVVLSKEEATEWILTHRLDGVIVHQKNGTTSIRSRPFYSMRNIHLPANALNPFDTDNDTILRTVGEKQEHQCIWGFINGIWSSKENALDAARFISDLAGGEQVLSMPNDSLGEAKDIIACILLKISIDTPVIQITVKFFRHLLLLSTQQSQEVPIVIFAHSMGAIICQHALELLNSEERQKLRIYTFGGGSFIAPGKCHPDSHNFASASDLICLIGSPFLRTLAIRRYWGLKEGLTEEQLVDRWVQEGALLLVDVVDPEALAAQEQAQRCYFEKQLKTLSNVTLVDPGSRWDHSFADPCYRNILKTIVLKYCSSLDHALAYTSAGKIV